MLFWAMRNAGKRGATVRVDHVLWGEDLVKIMVMTTALSLGDDVSASAIEAEVRAHIREYGTSRLNYFGDEHRAYGEEESKKLWSWARGQVLRHWPALESEIPEVWS